MAQTTEKSFQKANYGLRREILSPMETLAQSVSTMAPTTTPPATTPLVCALAGNGYSVVDYSGAVDGILYGANDGITNPIVPLVGCSPRQALSAAPGTVPGSSALNPNCFGLPLLSPGALKGAIPSNDPYETNFIDPGQRNIFRQS